MATAVSFDNASALTTTSCFVGDSALLGDVILGSAFSGTFGEVGADSALLEMFFSLVLLFPEPLAKEGLTPLFWEMFFFLVLLFSQPSAKEGPALVSRTVAFLILVPFSWLALLWPFFWQPLLQVN